MISTGMNLVMTVIGFAMSTMFMVFVCTRLVCARVQINASRRSFPVATRSDLSMLERGTLDGIEPVVVANFPTKKYSDECFSATEDAQCTICLSDYHGEDALRILPYCGHSFHVTCIDMWLQQHSTCPVCRISLREFPEKKRLMQPLFSSAIRSPRRPGSFSPHANNYLLRGQGFSPRTHHSHGIDPDQENHYTPENEGAEAGGNIFPTAEDNQAIKDSGNKRVESPSST